MCVYNSNYLPKKTVFMIKMVINYFRLSRTIKKTCFLDTENLYQPEWGQANLYGNLFKVNQSQSS